MSLVLLALQGLALVCAGLALALPAYVFAIVLWSVILTAAAETAELGGDVRRLLARARRRRAGVVQADGAPVGATALP